MKTIAVAFIAMFAGVVLAQVPPSEPAPKQAPREFEKDMLPAAAIGSADLAKLVKAQTEAIRALSEKVTALEKRLTKLELKR